MGVFDMVAAPILDIVNKLIPDPAAKAQLQLQLAQLAQQNEFKELDNQLAQVQTQTDTNKAEAVNTSVFVAGWRPFIGWICGAGVGFNYLIIPLTNIIGKIVGHPIDMPLMDLSTMMPLLIGMLGLGGMRSYEKVNGVNSGN